MKTFPLGFRFFGLSCGIKKGGKNDLGLFYSEKPCSAAGVFTRNLVKAASVQISSRQVRNKGLRAIIANSGCANACTGQKGMDDALFMCGLTAKKLGLKTGQVLVASTGTIGKYLDMKKITPGIEKLCEYINSTEKSSPVEASKAIMTTDTTRKTSSISVLLGNKKVSLWACAKGSGMIHPDMATFLCFIFTDCSISSKMLDRALRSAADGSFNLMSVDSVTSTNDTVFLLANAEAGNRQITAEGRDFLKFSSALGKLCEDLAMQVTSDGEGASKSVLIDIKNARTKQEAKAIAQAVAMSPLVKTAVFGSDANWGRIITSIGASGVRVDPSKVNIYFGKVCVCRNGQAADFSEAAAKRILDNPPVKFIIDLRSGKETLRYYTCDMGYDYIRINASYRT